MGIPAKRNAAVLLAEQTKTMRGVALELDLRFVSWRNTRRNAGK
jgi:hypothetical protein